MAATGAVESSGNGFRRGPSTRSRNAILAATGQLLSEVGYAGLTIEGTAARAGVGKTTVYRWWPSKAALAIEVLSERASIPPTRETGDLRTDLVQAVERVIAVLTRGTEGAIIPAMTADLVRDPAVAELFRDRILRPRRSVVADMITGAVVRGDLPDELDVSLVLDACVGAVFYRLVVSGEPVTGKVAEHLVDLLLDGARPRTARPRSAGRRRATTRQR
jgi:AcrR family transcriptional regulator